MPTPKADADRFDSDLVRELADILNESGLSEIEVEHDGLKVRVAKVLTAGPVYLPSAAAAAVTSPAALATPAEVERIGEVVTSPMVGTIYLQAQPGSPPFAKVGDQVVAGQTLLLVEAMKTMNPIAAPRAGTVLEFLVADAQPVEYGEPLVVIG